MDRAVRVNSPEEFQKVFGVPEYYCRLEFAIRQFFANGGTHAVVVRIAGTRACNKIILPGAAGELVLEARNPGPLEFLRASIDYDGLDRALYDADELDKRFNLVIQRLRSPTSGWIESQECFRNISVDRASRDFVGYVLSQSELVQLSGESPAVRPDEIIKPTTMREAGYIEAISDGVQSPPPSDYDLVGSTAHGTGLAALEHIADLGQLCLLPGADGQSLGPVALLAADQFCRERQAMLITDPPERWRTIADVLDDQGQTGFSSPNALTWYPGVQAKNRLGRTVPTTVVGSVAAALTTQDSLQGVEPMHPDGPVMLRGGVKLLARPGPDDVRRLARAGINSLVQRSPLHVQLQGNVSQGRFAGASHSGNNLGLRLKTLFILRRIRLGTRWTLFLESSPALWLEVTEQITEFLGALHGMRVLAGESPSQAFFVRCDDDTNRGLGGRMGGLELIVGFALEHPNEYQAFRLHIAAGECRITEMGWHSGFAQAV